MALPPQLKEDNPWNYECEMYQYLIDGAGKDESKVNN